MYTRPCRLGWSFSSLCANKKDGGLQPWRSTTSPSTSTNSNRLFPSDFNTKVIQNSKENSFREFTSPLCCCNCQNRTGAQNDHKGRSAAATGASAESGGGVVLVWRDVDPAVRSAASGSAWPNSSDPNYGGGFPREGLGGDKRCSTGTDHGRVHVRMNRFGVLFHICTDIRVWIMMSYWD
jgi:hypothetical protein